MVKCNLNKCLNNINGLCQKDNITLDKIDEYSVECLDCDTQEMRDTVERVILKWIE